MTVGVAVGFGEGLALVIQQRDGDTGLRRTVFQTLGENVQPVMIAVSGQTDIAQGKERCGIAVAVMPGLIHHRDINARLLERLDIFERQEQFFTRVARRVEIEAAGVDQFRHLQQIVRFPVGQRVTVLPLADKRGQRLRLHAVEIDVHIVDVKRHHRQTFHHLARQQRAATGKTDRRLYISRGQGFFIINAKGRLIQRLQAAFNGDDQITVRLQMTQAQLFQIGRKLPRPVNFAAFFIHDMHRFGEILIGIQRYREGQHQRGGTVELNFRGIQQGQRFPLTLGGQFSQRFSIGLFRGLQC